MKRADVEKILKEKHWHPTLGAPKHVVDYQRSSNFRYGVEYNRIILYPSDLEKLTESKLNRLMDETNLSKHAEILQGYS